MHHRGGHSLRGRNWSRFLVALLFAISVPVSTSFASLAAIGGADSGVPAMSCHEPATPASHDDGKSDPAAALQHQCCFTACIQLAASGDMAVALALSVGEPLVTSLSPCPMARAIGVDPPPPRA